MGKHEVVQFCIKIIENNDIYFVDGEITELTETATKELAIAEIAHYCHENRWRLLDILYLAHYYTIDNIYPAMIEWISDKDNEDNSL